VGHQAASAGFGEVVREQQDALGAQALGLLRILDRQRGAAAGPGDDGRAATAGVHRHAHDIGELARLQRKELAGAAGGEQHRGAVGLQPFQALRVRARGEAQVGAEVGQGK